MTAPHAVDRLPRTTCPGCSGQVLHVVDVDTDEPIVVDAEPTDEGRILVWALKGHAYARRYGQPARVQPSWSEHECPSPTVLTPVAKPVDPYEDESPAKQQHGGWRQ